MIKAFAPATVSNVAIGFDIMGFPMEAPGDEVVIRKGQEPGTVISKITKGKGLSYDPYKNTAGVAVIKMMEHLGIPDQPIDIEIRKKMPFGTGIGSSAASAVAAVVALNHYLEAKLTKRELLPFAMAGEAVASGAWHGDNVIPSMMGGIILIRDNATLDFTKLYVPNGLRYVVILPPAQILTSESRSILSDTVTLKQMITQTGNAATLVAALYSSDFDKISRCLQDVVIEPQRKHLIPKFDQMKEKALELGALGFSISGSGPSMFALCSNTFSSDAIEAAAREIYGKDRHGKDAAQIYQAPINLEGAEVC